MADNVAITAGAGTAISTDDVGGAHYQRVKVVWGPNGTINETSLVADMGVPVQVVPGTSGGLSISHLVSAATANPTSVKASAGQVYGINVFNNASAPRYVKFHNTAGAPTAGADVVFTVGIQAGVWEYLSFPQGIAFGTGIAFTTVTGIADSNSTAVGAAELVIDVLYK